jgi:hypothetical protein
MTNVLPLTSGMMCRVLTCYLSLVATRWRTATIYLSDKSSPKHDGRLKVRTVLSLRFACERLPAKLGSAPAPFFGLGWIWPHAMHAMAGEHLGVKCLCELDGGWRKAKIGGAGKIEPRRCHVSAGELPVALTNEAFSLCAHRRVGSSLGWHGGGG